MSKSLVAEALADAKEFKKMAIENARLQLAESVTPEIKKLLEAKLSEDLDQDADDNEMTDEKPEVDEAFNALMEKLKEEDPEKYEAVSQALAEKKKVSTEDEEKPAEDAEPKENADESLDIESALAEIEKGQVAETKDADADDEEKPAEEAPVEDDDADDDEIDEDYISRIMAEVEDAEPDADADDKDPSEEPMEEGAIEDILAKIKSLPADLKKKWDEEYSPKAVKAKMDAGKPVGVLTGNIKEEDKAPEEDEEEVKTEELLELKNSLLEVNLLAAKLMFQNKLLLSENFTNEHKARIILAFDKVKTVNEAKLMFETLNTASKPKAKTTPLAESLGFRRIGSQAPVLTEGTKASYDESDPIVAKMMQRAGIKKH